MTVYIVHRDIPYENGYVLGVFATPQEALDYIERKVEEKRAMDISPWYARDYRDELSVEDWEVGQGL